MSAYTTIPTIGYRRTFIIDPYSYILTDDDYLWMEQDLANQIEQIKQQIIHLSFSPHDKTIFTGMNEGIINSVFAKVCFKNHRSAVKDFWEYVEGLDIPKGFTESVLTPDVKRTIEYGIGLVTVSAGLDGINETRIIPFYLWQLFNMFDNAKFHPDLMNALKVLTVKTDEWIVGRAKRVYSSIQPAGVMKIKYFSRDKKSHRRYNALLNILRLWYRTYGDESDHRQQLQTATEVFAELLNTNNPKYTLLLQQCTFIAILQRVVVSLMSVAINTRSPFPFYAELFKDMQINGTYVSSLTEFVAWEVMWSKLSKQEILEKIDDWIDHPEQYTNPIYQLANKPRKLGSQYLGI